MNPRYSKGARIERKAIEKLQRCSNLVIRSAGSHSPFDVIAIDGNEVRLIQLKACKKFYPNILDSAVKEVRQGLKFKLPENCKAEVWIHEDKKGFIKYELCKDTIRKIGDLG
jgi:Holliday junction resolvase